jgi:hypothetical protein
MNNTKTSQRLNNLLTSSASWHNPLFFKGKEIVSINFIENGKLVLKEWDVYNDRNTKTAISWFGSNSCHKTIMLDHEVKGRRKLDLTRVEHSFCDNKLYLHTELLDNFKVVTIDKSDAYYKQYQKTVSFDAMSSGRDIDGEFTRQTLTAANFVDSEPTKLYNLLDKVADKFHSIDTYTLQKLHESGLLNNSKLKAFVKN